MLAVVAVGDQLHIKTGLSVLVCRLHLELYIHIHTYSKLSHIYLSMFYQSLFRIFLCVLFCFLRNSRFRGDIIQTNGQRLVRKVVNK